MHSLRVTAISSRTRAISASRSLRISAIVAKLRLIDSIPDASTSGRSLDDDDDDDPRSEEKKKKDMQKHCFSACQGVSAPRGWQRADVVEGVESFYQGAPIQRHRYGQLVFMAN